MAKLSQNTWTEFVTFTININWNRIFNMKEITLTIEDKKFEAFVNFLKTLDYVKVAEDSFTLREFRRSLNEVKLMQTGKLRKRDVRELLNEL